jgi:hypothetical protein
MEDNVSQLRHINQQRQILEIRLDQHKKLFDLNCNIINLERWIDKILGEQRKTNIIRKVISIAEEIFPGKCDIRLDVVPQTRIHTNQYGSNHALQNLVFDRFKFNNSFDIIIHFPYLKLTSESGSTHDLRDYFIKIEVTIKNDFTLEFSKTEGLRMTFTPLEFATGYRHSHQQTAIFDTHNSSHQDYRNQFGEFCTGSGDINSALALINNEQVLDEDQFRLYLLQIQPYLEWESISGVPYRRIDQLKPKNYELVEISDSSLGTIYRRYEPLLDKLNVDWKIREGKFVIVANEKFEEFLRIIYDQYKPWFYYKDERGELYKEARPPADIFKILPTDWIPFRGEKVFLKIEGENIVFTSQDQPVYAHPQIKEYVKQKLERRANIYKVREIAIARAATLSNT